MDLSLHRAEQVDQSILVWRSAGSQDKSRFLLSQMDTPDKPLKEYNWDEIAQNASKHFMDIFITPEVMQRQDVGELPRPLDLRAAQIIFYPNGKKPTVRINSEVKVLAKMKLKPGIEKDYGDAVYANDLDGLEELMLTNEDAQIVVT